MLWFGDPEGRKAESKLAAAKSAAVRVCNQSEKHRNWVQLLSERQPSRVQVKEFLDLVQ